jgi:FkbM family methyltransferase
MMSPTDKPFNHRFVGEVYRTDQGIFCVDPADQAVAKMLIEDGHYGTGQLAQLKMFCNEDSSVLLLGAHIGAVAVPLSKMVKNLTVFEANPRTYELLGTNLKLNDCANVEAFNLAANDVDTQIRFVLNTINSGGSKRYPVHKDEVYFYDDPDVILKQAVRLDDFLQGKQYDVIFMDIEGSEYFAMKGMPRLMAAARIVFVEFLPHHLSRVAGISIDQFLECLTHFETMISPVVPAAYHGADIGARLREMFDAGAGDEGLIFSKDRLDLVFN